MKIEGLETINDTSIQRAILDFIFAHNIEESDIRVIDEEEDLYSINDEEYVIISTYKSEQIINSYNSDLFDDMVTEVRPIDWIDYIDKDKWIESNGEDSFEYYYSSYYDIIIDYYTSYGEIDFYKVI